MMWDFIRDFFVKYIFGGWTSNGEQIVGFIGYDCGWSGNNFYTANTIFKLDDFYFFDDFDSPLYITIGDWLSTTATIICMVLISICFILLVRWIFKAVASAFLLK